MKIQAQCFCGTQVELWVPPTVRCPKCGAIFAWDSKPLCVSGEKLMWEMPICGVWTKPAASEGPEIPEVWKKLDPDDVTKVGDKYWDPGGTDWGPIVIGGYPVGLLMRDNPGLIVVRRKEPPDPSLHKNPFAKPQKCKTVEEWMQRNRNDPIYSIAERSWKWLHFGEKETGPKPTWLLPYRIWEELPGPIFPDIVTGYFHRYDTKEEAIAALRSALIATGEIEPC